MTEPSPDELRVMMAEIDATLNELEETVRFYPTDIQRRLTAEKECVFSCQRLITLLTLPRE